MRLVRSVIAVVVGVIVVVIFEDFIVTEIIMGPRSLDFPTYKAFCELSHFLGLGDQLCFTQMNFSLQSTTMGGNFSAFLLVAIMGGIVVAFPYIIYELWGFIKPGLKIKEVKSANGIVFYVSLLFFTGVLFGYYVLAPLSIQFLGNFQFADVQVQATVLSYLKLTTTLVGHRTHFPASRADLLLGKNRNRYGCISSQIQKACIRCQPDHCSCHHTSRCI